MVPLSSNTLLTQRDHLDVFSYVPLTFSFRTNEPTFFDDLQNFARSFLALRDGKPAESIKPCDKFVDRFGGEHQVYYNFNYNFSQKPVIPSQVSRFRNISAAEVKVPASFEAGKHLWILKPAAMSRGRGLELFTELSQLTEFLKLYMQGYEAKDFKQMKYSDKSDRSPSYSKELKNQLATPGASVDSRQRLRQGSTPAEKKSPWNWGTGTSQASRPVPFLSLSSRSTWKDPCSSKVTNSTSESTHV